MKKKAVVMLAILLAIVPSLADNALRIGIEFFPVSVNEGNIVQRNSTISINIPQVNMSLPLSYYGTGTQTISIKIPTDWTNGYNWQVNESGTIKSVTVVDDRLQWSATLSNVNPVLLFDVPPPSIEEKNVTINSTACEKNFTIETPNHFTNVSANVSINASYTYWTLLWLSDGSWLDKTTEFNLRVVNGTAYFHSFNTSDQQFRIVGSVNCTESWSCTAWSDATNNCGTRTCTDSNSCGTTNSKPATTADCPGGGVAAGGGGGGGGAKKAEKGEAANISAEKEITALLDVSVEIPAEYQTLFPGETLLSEIRIYKLAGEGRVDVRVDYLIKGDEEAKLIDHQTVAVETQASFIKSVKLPDNIAPGSYSLLVEASYEKTFASSSASFEVLSRPELALPTALSILTPEGKINFTTIILIVIATIQVGFMFFIGLAFLDLAKKHKEEKEEAGTKKKKAKTAEEGAEEATAEEDEQLLSELEKEFEKGRIGAREYARKKAKMKRYLKSKKFLKTEE